MGADGKVVHVLDYGAGNVRSVENAIVKCGFEVKVIKTPEEIMQAEVLVFPGVGSFGNAIRRMEEEGFVEPLKEYIAADKRFFGVCLGMQTLFEGSEEDSEYKGLGIIPGIVKKFTSVVEFAEGEPRLSVPHIGWNTVACRKGSRLFSKVQGDLGTKRTYFVHSYCAMPSEANKDWVLCTTRYGTEFISAVQKGNVMATQFHPEKSGALGLEILRGFLEESVDPEAPPGGVRQAAEMALSRRVIACLDVRKNDAGDLVVTKGDGYDVREKKDEDKEAAAEAAAEEAAAAAEPAPKKGKVRNFGKPAELAKRYYEEGADEITFLNITQFREDTLEADTMHEMLRAVSENVFVPLTIGGGIRDYGTKSALEVAARYFRSGADKVSLGSYAVEAVIRLRDELQGKPDGTTAIERISNVYGSQAVVISVDPRRIYLETDEEVAAARAGGYTVFDVVDDRKLSDKIAYRAWLATSVGEPAPEEPAAPADPADLDKVEPKPARCWFQCTVAGGRKRRPLDAVQLVKGVEALGAGEILLNSIDKDGKNSGFDISLVNAVRGAVTIPVIASSGAGAPAHFVECFEKTPAEAALAAGIFHRSEVNIGEVKGAVAAAGLPVRI